MRRPVRIAGQAPEDWSEAARAELEQLAPMATGRPLHLPSVIAHHPRLLPPYLAWAKAIAGSGVLPARDSALLALRTALRCGSEFEWGVHAHNAVSRAALTAAQVSDVARGADAEGWSAREAALLRAADELHDCCEIGTSTWNELARAFDRAALLEIALVVGHYTMLSMLANSAGVPPDPRWPALGRAPG
jgi:alkylhydroperoxidase family enzyme